MFDVFITGLLKEKSQLSFLFFIYFLEKDFKINIKSSI